VLLDLQGKTCLVVGGGQVAERKISGLLHCGAVVEVAARDLTPGIARWVESGKVRYGGETFEDRCMRGVFLVIAATDDRELNRRVALSASQSGILVNAVDQPEDCAFIVPSVIRRGDLIVALSTSGRSPALAKKLREELEEVLGEEYGVFLELMGSVRERVLALGLPQEENAKIFKALVGSGILSAIRDRNVEGARQELARLLPHGLAAEMDLNRISGA
jgi:precorrin-2 dehydrogenase/sirohydrochlorin ferrochelatase